MSLLFLLSIGAHGQANERDEVEHARTLYSRYSSQKRELDALQFERLMAMSRSVAEGDRWLLKLQQADRDTNRARHAFIRAFIAAGTEPFQGAADAELMREACIGIIDHRYCYDDRLESAGRILVDRFPDDHAVFGVSMFQLPNRRLVDGRVTEAEEGLRAQLSSPRPLVRAYARLQLGDLLAAQGDRSRARIEYRLASEESPAVTGRRKRVRELLGEEAPDLSLVGDSPNRSISDQRGRIRVLIHLSPTNRAGLGFLFWMERISTAFPGSVQVLAVFPEQAELDFADNRQELLEGTTRRVRCDDILSYCRRVAEWQYGMRLAYPCVVAKSSYTKAHAFDEGSPVVIVVDQAGTVELATTGDCDGLVQLTLNRLCPAKK